MSNTRKYLVLLFVFSVLLKLSLSFLNPLTYWDESIYANLGKNLIRYGEYSFAHGFADFFPNLSAAGARPPLIPFLVSVVFLVSENNFWLNFIVPLLSSAGIFGIYLLGKRLFNKEVARYSAGIYAFFPMNVFWGSKLLTDISVLTFLIFSCYFFFRTFDSPEIKTNYSFSIWFGVFFALAFFTRYTVLWFVPFFVIWLLYNRGLSFLKDKRIYISIISFLTLVVPWFIFNYFQYHSVFGFINSSLEASVRWGSKPPLYYLKTLAIHFWFLLPLSSLGLIFYKKLFLDKTKINFILLWLFVVFLAASITSAKDHRYISPIIPPIIILAAIGIYFLNYHKKIKLCVVLALVLILAGYNIYSLNSAHSLFNSIDNTCFLETMDYIKKSNLSYVVTEHFSPVYFHTNIPNIRVSNYTETIDILQNYYRDMKGVYYYVEGDWFNLKNETTALKSLYQCQHHEVLSFN